MGGKSAAVQLSINDTEGIARHTPFSAAMDTPGPRGTPDQRSRLNPLRKRDATLPS
jgi:hypothetical protein